MCDLPYDRRYTLTTEIHFTTPAVFMSNLIKFSSLHVNCVTELLSSSLYSCRRIWNILVNLQVKQIVLFPIEIYILLVKLTILLPVESSSISCVEYFIR